MTHQGEQDSPQWLRSLREAISRLPDDYREFYSGVTDIRHQVINEIAQALQGRMNAHYQSLPQATFRQKQEIAHHVNDDLRQLNLCIRCPVSGDPSILIADFRDSEERNSRFRIESHDTLSRRHRRVTSTKVPELMLQESSPRKEPFSRRAAPAKLPGRE